MKGEQVILQKLEKIEKQVAEIRNHMIDVDTILDKDDLEAIKEAEKEFEEGRTVTLEQLKKELGL